MSTPPGEDSVCPLCMEQIEFDDLSFYPCQCGYQICRFCWHRIRTNENGLCPACRKLYASSPDRFQPVTIEQHKQHKKMKKTVPMATKRNLVDLRVIQKNLIFVIGLSLKIASVEELKKFVYFGKYGKILKVVVSSSGQTGSAYITYLHSNDALRAIQKTNNIVFDNKLIKTSLGTTKYCSYYLKQQTCTKAECMYLHTLGEDEASFTKEDMLQGKHTEYERRLIQEFVEREMTAVQHGEVTGDALEEEVTHPLESTAQAPEEEHNSPPPEELEETQADHFFDPFNETNQIFEELIRTHSKGEGERCGVVGLMDPPLPHPPPYYPTSQVPPGFNWLPQPKAEPEWSDPAIIFSQLYPPAGIQTQMEQQQQGYSQYSMFPTRHPPTTHPPPGFPHHHHHHH